MRANKKRSQNRLQRGSLPRKRLPRAGSAEPKQKVLPAATMLTAAEPNSPGTEIVSSGKGPNLAASPQAPEERELLRKRAQLSVLESELARQERLLSRLNAELLPFEASYFRKLGIRCAKLDEIEARIAELHAEIHPDDLAAQDAARRARERADRSRNAILRRNSRKSFDPPPALKRLYRAVARRVHPDLSETAADRKVRESLMAHANRAYQSGDERRLRAIVSEYEYSPETVRGEGTPVELVRVIRKIAQARRRAEEIQEEMERVRSSELFRFKRLAESQAKRGRDLFADAVAAVDTRIAGALATLKHLETASAGSR